MWFSSRFTFALSALILLFTLGSVHAQLDLSKELNSVQAPAPAAPAVMAPSPVASSAPPRALAPVQAKVTFEDQVVKPGQALRAIITLTHDKHWHVYGATIPEGAFGKPTTFAWTLPEGWKVEPQPWPETKTLPSTGGATIEGYEGVVSFAYVIQVPEGIPASGKVPVKVRFSGLVCDPKTCRPVTQNIETELTLGESPTKGDQAAQVAEVFETLNSQVASEAADKSENASQTAAAKPTGSVWSYLHLAFIGGLILNVMPCVFPVLGIKIMGIAKQSGNNKSHLLAHSLAYTFGVLICFWGLVFLLNGLKAAGAELAWGFQLQSPVFVFVLTLGLFAFGLNMAGVFEVGTSAVGAGSQLSQKSGVSGSFFSGLFATVVATPCAAPFLAPTLGFALSLELAPSLLLFTVMGLGLALPYLLLPFFPQALKLLPKPGAWMESFKQAMSFLLFGTAAYLLWVYASLVDDYGLLQVLFAIVLVAAACWVYGRWTPIYKAKSTRIKGLIAALLLAGVGIWMAYPSQAPKLEWKEWSPELVEQLEKEGKPVYIDYTARWCVTCQVNKRVYQSPELQKLITEKGVVLLKADWTNEDPRITRALAELDRAAVPVNTLKKPGEKEVWILPELLTEANVAEFLKKL